ncbi:MAG: orotate phosphoribosyltransferase [Spirochaetia bacterium]|nr:orotate phosphoribosyltransferase [Spirochaetia bacterium]
MHGQITLKLFQFAKDEIYKFSSEPFTLASGQQSQHYFNCKKITLLPERLSLLAEALKNELIPVFSKTVPQAVGGLTLGADPISYALSLAYLKDGNTVFPLVVRKEAKGHGTLRQIEGEAEQVDEVIVLDDVITTAGSTIKAVHAFRSAGIRVKNAVCIVDREEGGKEALEKEEISLYSLFVKSDFI